MRLPKLPVRQQYLRIAWRALREGKVGWVARQGLKTFAVPLSARVGRPLSGPLLVNFLITYRCNSRCFMCDWSKFHKTRGRAEIDTPTAKRIIDSIADLGAVGLNLTGGEPSLRADWLELVAYGKASGLFVNVNTNGSRLADHSRVDALLASGVDSINLSLDGARAETHDRLRGMPGSFEKVRDATELLLHQRRGGQPTVTYVFTVGPENHMEMTDFVALARERGVDSVGFIPLLPIYEGHRPLSPDQLAETSESMDQLRRLKRNELPDFIDNSDEYLSLFARSWRGEPSPLRCYVPYAHLAIDSYGNAYPCGVWVHNDQRVGNVLETDLRKLWRSAAYRDVRRQLASCRACYWNCHAEANLLYQRAGE